MDSKNKISISFRNEDQQETKNEVVRTQKEQAAAVEEDKKGDRHETRVYQIPLKKMKRFSSPVRPFLATALTALIISLGLGFLLLRMFVSLTDQTDASSQTSQVTGDPVNSEATASNNDEQGTELPSGTPQTLDSYIVQAGAFSTEGKAKEWRSKLTALLVPSVIWQRDGQYFLFVGSANSKKEANVIADRLAEKSIETYVKPFAVTIEKEVPEELITSLQSHELGKLSENERQGFIEKVGNDTTLGKVLTDWESQDDSNINWLKVAQSLE
ncbi:stage II sporulation protein B [Halobacillus karajensis]|uniref:Rare lipoprotein A n=1 Tax=Halobacillus karajensis TaxID=195088 RepID=A0A024P6Y1_9BACI|nr:SPOR domain-containing protein [Halobacillus karajensis]CDQ18181.1 rare lipoprotein A [Halobacillus karajensis]CDQ24533.1 rare lipoprotein A [Halobacillus karajensis]CDQ29220.1 rare lipoprotein A [Halobacillus karajensis]SEH57728.1 stage II sporulation protein B [Halobacillus karajensis]